MDTGNEILEQLQRYYTLWKESNAIYEEWAKAQGLSSNSLLVIYSFYDNSEVCTQKSISQKWYIPKQTVNTILKDFIEKGLVEMSAIPEDKRNKEIRLTPKGKRVTDKIMKKLQKKELQVMNEIGIERITEMNDTLTQFIQLFRNGEMENES